ncbi:MAG: alpha/beta hydrolase [Anaerolineales bacterium]|nr:alpha/beta hydrolase [Anaerolineales bacterium]
MPSLRSKVITGFLRAKNTFKRADQRLDIQRERASAEAMARSFGRLRPAECVPVTANGVPAEWVLPDSAGAAICVLYLHGGVFYSGSINSHRSLAANLAFACGGCALIIDYRLSPEHPFPNGLEDVQAAYQWLLEAGKYSPESIVVAGDSAGGTLALSLALSLRETGQPLPAAVVCLSPVTDLTLGGETWKTHARRDVMLEYWKIKKGMEMYLNGEDPRDPLASPLYANLRGLPPTLIQVGSEEMLLSDARRFSEKAKVDGMSLELEIWDGMQHEWQFAYTLIPEARQAMARIGAFISRHTS